MSGVKAHTIRIWEKRYGLLEPSRTSTNIRSYDNEALRKLLNVQYLREQGWKISHIAGKKEKEVDKLVFEHAAMDDLAGFPVRQLKMAMMEYDAHLFNAVYRKSLDDRGFENTMEQLIVPFLKEIGLLWQTNTIEVSHEHFLGHLIRQKLCCAMENLQEKKPDDDHRLFVLFTPTNESHELGLMYVNYLLMKKGYRTIYLGTSIDINGLVNLKGKGTEQIFIGYATVEPQRDKIEDYLNDFNRKIQSETTQQLWLLGNIANQVPQDKLFNRQHVFKDIPELNDFISRL